MNVGDFNQAMLDVWGPTGFPPGTPTNQYDLIYGPRGVQARFMEGVTKLVAGAYEAYSDDDESWARTVQQIYYAGGFSTAPDPESFAINNLAADVLANRAMMAQDIAVATAYVKRNAASESARLAPILAAEAAAAAEAARKISEAREWRLKSFSAGVRDLTGNPAGANANAAAVVERAFPGGAWPAEFSLADLEAARARGIAEGSPLEARTAFLSSVPEMYRFAMGRDMPTMPGAGVAQRPSSAYEIPVSGGSDFLPKTPPPTRVESPAPVAAPVPVGATSTPTRSAQETEYHAAYIQALNRAAAGGSSPFLPGAQVGSVDYSQGIPSADAPAPARIVAAPVPAAPRAPAWLIPALAAVAVILFLPRGSHG